MAGTGSATGDVSLPCLGFADFLRAWGSFLSSTGSARFSPLFSISALTFALVLADRAPCLVNGADPFAAGLSLRFSGSFLTPASLVDHFAGEQRQWLGLVNMNRGENRLARFDDEIAHFDIRPCFGWL